MVINQVKTTESLYFTDRAPRFFFNSIQFYCKIGMTERSQ